MAITAVTTAAMTAAMTATITAATTAAMTAKMIVAITNHDQAELSTKELWLVVYCYPGKTYE